MNYAPQKVIIAKAFGGPEQLECIETVPLVPRSGEVVIDLKCIGMNQADLMARRGEYRLSSGAPPFTPGIEGGGVISAVGEGVNNRHVGERVILTMGAPVGKGTYRSQFLAKVEETLPLPKGISDELMGALWLPFLTAWGALVWRQGIQPGQVVMLPAASSSVAIAASQIAKQQGCITIGVTTSPEKVQALKQSEIAKYDYLLVTNKSTESKQIDTVSEAQPWWRLVKKITNGKGVDVILDPVAAGEFLNTEIRLLAQGGTLWVYGLLGQPDTVDVSPLIRKNAAIRGWLLNSLAGTSAEHTGYQHILQQVSAGNYRLPIAGKFALHHAQQAQTEMEKGKHIGKYILQP